MGKNTHNLIALVLIQASNALFPLVVFPATLKLVGPENFSKIVTTESIILVLLAFVVYSFDVDGASKVLYLSRDNINSEISKIYSGIMCARLFIFTILSLFILVIVLFTKGVEWLILVSGWLLIPLGYSLQSLWFYQAVEKNVFPSIIIVISRVLFAALILNLKSKNCFHIVPALIGTSHLVSGVVTNIYAVKRVGVNIIIPPTSYIKELILSGKDIFLANISVVLFRGSNIIILSIVSSEMAVSLYSLAEKYIKCLQAVIRPFNQLVYPKIVNELKGVVLADKKALVVVLKYAFPQLIILAFIVIFIATTYQMLSGIISIVNSLMYNDDLMFLLYIMVFSVFFGVCNFILGTAGLNNLNSKHYYAKFTVLTGFVTLFLSYVLASSIAETGSAISYTFGEICLFIAVIARYRYRYPIFGKLDAN